MKKHFIINKKKLFICLFTILFLSFSIWISMEITTSDYRLNQSNKANLNKLNKQEKKVNLHTAEQFGANGFDKMSDTNALQKAIDSSDTLILKSGSTYIIDKPLVSSHSIKIVSDNKTKKDPIILQISKQSAFIFDNEPIASTFVSKDILKNKTYITLKSTKGLRAGDLLHLKSNKLWHWDNRDYLKKGELHKITKVDGNKVYLDRNTSENYMVGEGEVVTARAYPNVSLELSSISFSHPKPYKTAMIKVNFTSNTKINDVSVRNSKHTGIFLNCTFQTEVKGAYINLGTTKDINTGYGIQDYGGTGTFITDSIFRKVRRGVDFSGVTPSRYGKVTNSKAYGYKKGTLASGNSGFGTHSTAENITFVNNFIENFNYAFLTRGNNITVEGNTLEGYSNSFIAISYGGHVTVSKNTYKSKNDSQLESFIMLSNTYKGSLSVTGNTVNGQKDQFIKGDIVLLEQAIIKGNNVNVK